MTDAMRSMLDELMGKERNVPIEEKKRTRLEYGDPEVCKYAMVGLCPYQLFKNTKSDLGPCGFEVHEDHIEFARLKKEYDAAPPGFKAGYSRELLSVLDGLVKEMDRKIARANERVEQENKPRSIKAADQIRLDALKQQEKECLEASEALAMDGDAERAMAMAEQAEKIKAQAVKLHDELVTPERTMSVCEICGVFINSTDNEQRRMDGDATGSRIMQDHINGKQYVGWKKIREKLEELQKEVGNDDRHDPGLGGMDRGGSRDRGAGSDRDRDRDGRYGREYDDRGYRGRDSDHYRGGGDRERDYDHDRYRGRGSDRHERDRGGERDRWGGREERRYGAEPPHSGYRRDDVRSWLLQSRVSNALALLLA